jgi:hypothetical protein
MTCEAVLTDVIDLLQRQPGENTGPRSGPKLLPYEKLAQDSPIG